MMKSVFTCLLLILTIQANTQTPYPNTYISEMPVKGLEQLDSVVNNYTVFFTGENHNYKKDNSNIQLKVLAYLNKQADVRNYILELGYARGYMLNAYINNDTSYYSSLKSTTSRYYLELYKALRKLNNELPDNKKITVHGVDVERFPDDGPMLLASLIPKNAAIPEVLAFDIEVLKSYANYSSVKYNTYSDYYESSSTIGYNSFYSYGFNNAETIDSIVESYKLKKPYYMELLKDKFTLFDKIFQSIIEYRKWSNYSQLPHQTIYRERMIYDNIAKLITEHPDDKYYGQFGRCHTSLSLINKDCNWYEVKPTAMRLNEGIAKGKTMTIGIFYDIDKVNNYEDYPTTEVVKKYIDVPCTNENTLMKIKPEDTLLSQHFTYILVNSNCSKDKFIKKVKYSYDDYHEWVVALDFGYGQSFFNLDRLNNDLKFTNGKGFKQPIENFSIGYTYIDFGNYNFGKFEQHLTQKVSLNGLSYTLSGYSATEGYGYSPFISKHFTIGAYGILGFQRFSMMIENDSFSHTPSPGFSPIKRYKYINNAFSVGVGLDLRLAFSPAIGIFARARYLADVSRKYWRNTMGSYGILDSNSPPTSLSNYSFQAGLSILIQE